MNVPTPAILVLFLALLAVIAAVAVGDGDPVRIYGADVEIPGTWRRESLPADRVIGFITDADGLERVRAASPRAVRGIDPAFAFEEGVLFVAYLGEMPTGGYGIRLESVEYRPEGAGGEAGGKVVVRLAVWSPGPDAFVTQAFTYPRDVVAIPKAAWPAGVPEALAAGRLEVDVIDQEGRVWGPYPPDPAG